MSSGTQRYRDEHPEGRQEASTTGSSAHRRTSSIGASAAHPTSTTMPAAVRDALACAASDSRAEVIRLQPMCCITTMRTPCEEAIRVLDLVKLAGRSRPIPTRTDGEEVLRYYVREKSALEASVVAYRLTQDSEAGGGFTLDDPCNLLGVCSRLHASWNRNAWALVPTEVEDVISWFKEANEEWEVSLRTDKTANRDLRLNDPRLFARFTYDFIVLDEDEFSDPAGFVAIDSKHETPQHYVARNGQLRCVADDVSFPVVNMPRRLWCDGVNPFIIVLSAFHRFRRTLEHRGSLPAYLHPLQVKLQLAVDLMFFKPPGWHETIELLTKAYVQMAMHGKRKRKIYRDRLAEAHEAHMRRRQRPYVPVVRTEPANAPGPSPEEKFMKIMYDPHSTGAEKNLAMFALLEA